MDSFLLLLLVLRPCCFHAIANKSDIMDRKEGQPRQSSLPSSLIPHLYSQPQPPGARIPRPDTERWVEEPSGDQEGEQTHDPPRSFALRPITPLLTAQFAREPPEDEQRNQAVPSISPTSGSSSMPFALHRYRSPINTDPVYYSSRTRPAYTSGYTYPPPIPIVPFPRPTSSEEQAGPSSLLQTRQLPIPQPHRAMRFGYDGGERETRRRFRPESVPQPSHTGRERERPPRVPPFDPPPSGGISQPRQPVPEQDYTSHNYRVSSTRQEAGFLDPRVDPYAALRQRMWHEGDQEQSRIDAGSSAQVRTRTPVETEDDEDTKRALGKRRSESEDIGEGTRVHRKADIACDFCRGRKLRCDGNRPSCWNCISRERECKYNAYPRRRGPGKAPRGSKTKKRGKKGEPSSSSSHGWGEHSMSDPSAKPDNER